MNWGRVPQPQKPQQISIPIGLPNPCKGDANLNGVRRMTDIPESGNDPPAAEPSSGNSLADQLSNILPSLKAQADATASIVLETIRVAEREASASVAFLAKIGTQLKQARTLREIGWIPHPALPIQNFAGSERIIGHCQTVCSP
jgi:hypothetical protein